MNSKLVGFGDALLCIKHPQWYKNKIYPFSFLSNIANGVIIMPSLPPETLKFLGNRGIRNLLQVWAVCNPSWSGLKMKIQLGMIHPTPMDPQHKLGASHITPLVGTHASNIALCAIFPFLAEGSGSKGKKSILMGLTSHTWCIWSQPFPHYLCPPTPWYCSTCLPPPNIMYGRATSRYKSP